jgi:hypothetical protein
VIKTVEGKVNKTAEAMTGIDMTTGETLTIIKAMTNQDPISGCNEGVWTRKYL